MNLMPVVTLPLGGKVKGFFNFLFKKNLFLFKNSHYCFFSLIKHSVFEIRFH